MNFFEIFLNRNPEINFVDTILYNLWERIYDILTLKYRILLKQYIYD